MIIRVQKERNAKRKKNVDVIFLHVAKNLLTHAHHRI